MKILNYLVIIFICINPSVKADSKKTFIDELQKGGKLIFIRHAYAPCLLYTSPSPRDDR